MSSILSLLGSSGAGAGAAAAGAGAGAGAAGAGAAGAGGSIMALLQGAGKSFERSLARNHEYFYEPPKENEAEKQAEEGQKNASGSNAPLDNSLGKEARKTAGVAEGGATPQLDNTISRDLIGIKRTPTTTQTVAPKEGLFTKLSNWWNGLGK